MGQPDGAISNPGPLTVSMALLAASVDGLVVDAGALELRRVSVFGDVAADERTMVAGVGLTLPTDGGDLVFSNAPYGLYSRVHADLDDVRVQGSWRGTPLLIQIEAETLPIDLRGPTLDYEPTDAAHFSVSIASSSWFDPVCLDAAAIDSGTIRIDELHNTNCGSPLLAAVQSSFSLQAVPAATSQ